jgi:hypothetical protein
VAVVGATIDPMVSDLANLVCERFAAHNAERAVLFGLDKPTVKATLITGEEGATKERILIVGGETGSTGTSFARLDGQDGVFVVAEALVRDLNRDALDLIDKQVLKLPADRIQKVWLKQPTQKELGLFRYPAGWQVVEGVANPFPADPESLRSLLSLWGNLNVDRYVVFDAKAPTEKYGLDKPTLTATIEVGSAEESAKKTLTIGKKTESGGYYARLDGGPAVFVLSEAVVDELRKSELDFVSRTVLTFKPDVVTAIVRSGADGWELIKQGGSWSLVKPAALPADEDAVKQLLSALSARAKTVAASAATDAQLKEFGLDASAKTVTLKLAEPDGKTSELVLRIGKEKPAGSSSDWYAQVQGGTTVVVLPAAMADQLLASGVKFRNRKLSDFFDARKIEVTRGNRKATLEIKDGVWKVTSPVTAATELTDLETMVSDISPLKVAEWIAENTTDEQLRGYGLADPAMRWRFFEDKEVPVLDLLIGGPGKDPATRFAKLEKGKEVFLLSPKLTKQLTAEYRERKVWPKPLSSPDAVSLEYERGPEKFTLTNLAGTWSNVQKPGEKIKASAVNETLAALQNLKVDYYAADKVDDKANLALYGLDTPAVIIQVGSRGSTEKHVLHLGGYEDPQTKTRRFAKLPNGSEVFVLSEQDTARIDRALPAFVDSAPK